MNAEQIIRSAIAEKMAEHQPDYKNHGCACGLHIAGTHGPKRDLGWLEFSHAHIDHVADVIAKELTGGALKGVAAA